MLLSPRYRDVSHAITVGSIYYLLLYILEPNLHIVIPMDHLCEYLTALKRVCKWTPLFPLYCYYKTLQSTSYPLLDRTDQINIKERNVHENDC